MTSSGIIELHQNGDCAQIDLITVENDAMITSPDIRIVGGGVHLFGRLNIDTGKLLFQEICSTDLSIGVGSSNLPNKMAIDNSALNNIIADIGSNKS